MAQPPGLEIIEIEPDRPAAASVVFLHGLGADGHDFESLVAELGLPAELAVRWVLPHAPVRPVTINGGWEMRAWYDIIGIGRDAPQDVQGIREMSVRLESLLERERSRGIAAGRLLLGGFSQGGALALHCGLRSREALAGVVALSTYVPVAETVPAESSPAGRSVPVFMAHGHFDPVVPYALGELSHRLLVELRVPVSWHSYPMAHTLCEAEIAELRRFILARLAPPR